MTHMCEESTALLPDQLQLFERMWELRLLDMALEELRIEGLINGPVSAAFGQEAVGIGASAALGNGDIAATNRRAMWFIRIVLGVALAITFKMVVDFVSSDYYEDVVPRVRDWPGILSHFAGLSTPSRVAGCRS